MKIVHICQYYNEGFSYQENILPKVQSIMDEITIITSNLSNFDNLEKTPGIRYDENVKIRYLKVKKQLKNRFVFFNRKELYESLVDEKPDIIFHHGLTAKSLFTVLKYKKNYNDTILLFDNHADLNNSGRNILWRIIYYRFFGMVLNFNYKKVNNIYALSDYRYEFLKDVMKIRNIDVKVINQGAKKKIKLKSNDLDIIKNQYDITSNTINIITGGKIDEQKKIHYLAKCVSEYNEKYGKKFTLNIFGKIIEEGLIEDYISDEIKFLGWKNNKQIDQLIQASDIAIFPGGHSTLFENVIMNKTPIILTYSKNTNNHIDGNGIYLTDENIEKQLNQILMILDNTNCLEFFKENCSEICKKFDYEEIANQIRQDILSYKDCKGK